MTKNNPAAGIESIGTSIESIEDTMKLSEKVFFI